MQDALGRVVGERVNNRETWYSYDGLNKSIRWRGKKSRYGSRTKVDFTLHGAGFDKHYLTFTDYKQDEVVFYHQDRMGSVYGLSSRRKPGSNLRIAEWNYYTAYGESTSFRSDGSPQPPGEHQSAFGFQGHRQDASTGLVDMRARMYKPAWGRFVQRDPIGLAGGSNQLAFVHSSPLKYTDPSGLDAGWFRDNAGENMLRLRQYGLGAMIPAVLPAGMSYGPVPKHFEQPNTGIGAKISSALLVADNTLRLSENGHRIGRVALGFEIAAGGCLLTAGIGCYASVLHGSDIAASGVTGGDTMVSRGARFAGIDPYYAEMFVGVLTLSAVALEAAIAARAQPLVMGMLDDGVGAVKVPKGGVTFPNTGGGVPSPVGRWKLFNEGGTWKTVGPSGQVRTASGEYVFVRQNGTTWVQRPMRSGHVDLARGLPVEYAGMVKFSGRTNRGVLRSWSNNSGHYRPPASHAGQAGLPMGDFEPVVGDKLRVVWD